MLHTSPSTFGHSLRVLTFGESHGLAVGVVLDGVKPGLTFDLDAIQRELDMRRPGQGEPTSPRQEQDSLQVLSGVFDGRTTGHPIAMIVFNKGHQPRDYEALKNIFRPGHADITYARKYGLRDHRGGGRASARETLARVAAGAWARQQLVSAGVSVKSFNREIAGITCKNIDWDFVYKNPLRVCDPEVFSAQIAAVEDARNCGDSVGGVSEIHIHGLPAGLGDPVFSKLDAMLAYACMSIGGVKGVEFGAGFESARMRGSQHNDAITKNGFATNNAGGILGGISNGDTIILRLAVKPTSSIGIRQRTINEAGQETEVEIQGRHDACIAPRLLPVAEAMCCLAIYDAMLSQADMSDDARDAEDEVITCYDWDSISKVISQGNGVQ